MFNTLRLACGELVQIVCNLVGRCRGIISTGMWQLSSPRYMRCVQWPTFAHVSPNLSPSLFTAKNVMSTTVNSPPFTQYPQHLLLLERDKEFKKG